MSRSEDQRFEDILNAAQRCLDYAPHLHDAQWGGMAFDAVLRNLAVIGEAVKNLPEETRTSMPNVPWAAIAGLRNVVVHEYFRVEPNLILDIVENELRPLIATLRARTS